MAASKVAAVPARLVDDVLGIEEGESVVIHGASGNVGMLAVQFAKLRGARVLATAFGRDGQDFARRLGADEAVNGKGGRAGYPNGIEPELRRAIEESELQIPVAAVFDLKEAPASHRRVEKVVLRVAG